jgi:hypothetical protein
MLVWKSLYIDGRIVVIHHGLLNPSVELRSILRGSAAHYAIGALLGAGWITDVALMFLIKDQYS